MHHFHRCHIVHEHESDSRKMTESYKKLLQYLTRYSINAVFSPPVLYYEFGNMVMFRSGKVRSTLWPRKPALSENYLFFSFFIKKGRNR